MDQQTAKLLTYTGKAQDFPIWSTRFVAMMQTNLLYKSLLGTEVRPNEPAPLANGANNDQKKNYKALKNAYEKEVADIKEKRNNVWCHLALTLDATTRMLMRHDCVGDDGIGDGAKAWKLLQERFQSVETTTVVTLVAQLAGLQLEDAEDLDGFFIRGQDLLTKLQEVGEAVSETLFIPLVLNGLPLRYESFVIQESFNLAANFTELKKRLQTFHESTAQRHKGQSDSESVALALKRDFKKEPKKGNCFVCGIPRHFAKDCRRKETAQCSNCGEEVTKTGHARDKEREANMSQWQWVQPWHHQRGNTGSSCPVEDSRHASGLLLYRTHSDEHRCVPGLCAHTISGQKSQRRGFQSGGQRLCEDQHTLKQRGIPMQTQKVFLWAGLFFQPLISLKMHGVGS